ncbi:hypothetical protein FG167_05225 [Lacinutrix sp. WUR7]|nr:hypothetical protein FG167_05225 [Lacinutrix sp. WUR7]
MIQNKKIIASILFLLISFVSVAQTMSGPPPPAPPPPPGLPIDAGIYLLLGIGLVYGIVKTIRSKA